MANVVNSIEGSRCQVEGCDRGTVSGGQVYHYFAVDIILLLILFLLLLYVYLMRGSRYIHKLLYYGYRNKINN